MNAYPVVFLNGPPRCGKDTLAGYIVKTLPGFRLVKFAQVLKERTHALYGRPAIGHDAFENVKDVSMDLFLGSTPREAYINVSERLMKPVHGDQVFGNLLLSNMLSKWYGDKAFVISDSGFVSEALPIISRFGRENCVLVRIHAEGRGCTFKGDSRSYIELPIESHDLFNNGTELEFLNQADQLLGARLQSIVGGH